MKLTSLETILARAGLCANERPPAGKDPASCEPQAPEPLCAPLSLSSVYRFRNLDQLDRVWEGLDEGHVYRRLGHPNQDALEEVVARLEGAEEALACASGMGALYVALVAHLSPGDTIIAQQNLYGGTQTLICEELRRWGMGVHLVPDASSAAVSAALRQIEEGGGRARAVLVETLANPSLAVADIPALGELAAGADLLLVVDNTFATPLGCRPLRWGPCLVVHSATKYLNGHSDVLGGVVAGSRALVGPVRKLAVSVGVTIAPFDAWLTLRGLRTLHLRWERQQANASRVAAWLEQHPRVSKVFYPGLVSHPTHERAGSVLDGPGAVVSFGLRGGEEAVRSFISRLGLVGLAPSLGETATTITYPALTSHRSLSPAEKEAAGAGPDIVRLSVGVEAIGDILADLARALAPPDANGG